MRVHEPKIYDDAFRNDAVALVERSGRSLNSVAVDLGIPQQTLRYWYNAFMSKKRPKKADALRAKSRAVPVIDPSKETAEAKIARLERENATLRHQVGQLEMDRAILKKAAAQLRPSSRRKANEVRVHPRGEGVFSSRSDVPAARHHASGVLRVREATARRARASRRRALRRRCRSLRRVRRDVRQPARAARAAAARRSREQAARRTRDARHGGLRRRCRVVTASRRCATRCIPLHRTC